MAEQGYAAKQWISCQFLVINKTQQRLAEYDTIPSSSVRQINVLAELDTGSRHLALTKQQGVQDLKLNPLGEPADVTSIMNDKPKKVQMFGPVIIQFCGKEVSVDLYKLKHASHVLLGLEPAQQSRTAVGWEAYRVFLLSTAYTHNAFTIGSEDLSTLLESNNQTIIGLQSQHKVSIEITNRKKVNKIMVIICTEKLRKNITEAATAIKEVCLSPVPAPEEK